MHFYLSPKVSLTDAIRQIKHQCDPRSLGALRLRNPNVITVPVGLYSSNWRDLDGGREILADDCPQSNNRAMRFACPCSLGWLDLLVCVHCLSTVRPDFFCDLQRGTTISPRVVTTARSSTVVYAVVNVSTLETAPVMEQFCPNIQTCF